jgi:hypothetical protein
MPARKILVVLVCCGAVRAQTGRCQPPFSGTLSPSLSTYISSLQTSLGNVQAQIARTPQPKIQLDAQDVYDIQGLFDIGESSLCDPYSEEPEKRYSPAVCIGCESHAVMGYPDPKHINTSYIERHNPSVRMIARRFTRLTNAFSKKIENHIASLALTYFIITSSKSIAP